MSDLNKNKVQANRLLEYLRVAGSVDPLTAWTALGIYRLAARVFELRQEGIDIKKETIKVENTFGEICHVARYTLNEARA